MSTCQIQEIPATREEQAIETTIKEMRIKGISINTREKINLRAKLRKIARETDIFNPIKVKEYIATKIRIASKNNYEYIYNHFCQTNQIPYDITRWKYKSPIALIPSTENVNTIINASTQNFYAPLKIMAEIAVEAEELHKTHRDSINAKTGEISITGTKGHDNGTYKLSQETTETLRLYLAKHAEEYPFPEPRALGEAFRGYRARRAKELNKPELLKVQMKNLRNYAGAVFYLTKGKDPIQTMRFMRHKQLETTMDYLRGLTEFTARARYITKTVKLGTPTTIQEITELSNTGFEKYNEADGYQFFRTLQY